MISAIHEIADLNDGVLQKSRLATAKYLEACSLIFEQGILSHSIIDRDNQVVLDNMKKGFSYFNEWHQEMLTTGQLYYVLHYCVYLSDLFLEHDCRNPNQKLFLAWQVCRHCN